MSRDTAMGEFGYVYTWVCICVNIFKYGYDVWVRRWSSTVHVEPSSISVVVCHIVQSVSGGQNIC